MTPDDKQIVAEYMSVENPVFETNFASLCVEKMVEKMDINLFLQYAYQVSYETETGFIPWLFNADNFFAAMAAWLRSK